MTAAPFFSAADSCGMDRYFTRAQQDTLLRGLAAFAAKEDRRDYAWIRFLLYSGLRIGEFTKITCGQAWAALDTRHLYIPAEHRKGGRSDHKVLLHDKLRQALEDLLELQLEFGGSQSDGEPLVLGRGGCAITPRALQLRFAQWMVVFGLPQEATPHWLRHTCAMRVLRASRAEDKLGTVQRALGHTSPASTRIYAHATKEELEQALTDAFADPAPAKPPRRTLSNLRKMYYSSRQEVY